MAINLANNNSLANITTLPSSISGGAMTLLSTQTASGSATISFTSGIDDTYDSYVFKFYDIHPATDSANFQVNFRDGGTDYDAVKTTTYFRAYHDEADSAAAVGYDTSVDLAQSTGVQILNQTVGNDNDQCCVGTLHLYNPSSTVFVKHFIFRGNRAQAANYTVNDYVAGYCNVTAAIDGVQFTMSSGNIDSGVIKLYGIS
jgi:hypothetical protein